MKSQQCQLLFSSNTNKINMMISAAWRWLVCEPKRVAWPTVRYCQGHSCDWWSHFYSCECLRITVGYLTPKNHTFFLNLMYLCRDKMYCMITYLLTYSLTPWSRVLLEKLTVFQLVKKFSAFYGTRRFITTVTSACHLPISRASSI